MDKLEQLKERLRTYQKVAIGYSGGCDSNFLYQVALDTLGKENVLAVLCVGKMMSQEDLSNARALLASNLAVEVAVEVLKIDAFLHNRRDRCYHCKKVVMANVIEQAHKLGFEYILDGKNADDNKVYRPGIKACKELGILSPLSDVNLSKQEIRAYSKQLKLTTHDRPANACLASRFPYDTLITEEKLTLVDLGEQILHQHGLHHVRLRVHDKLARLEVEKEQFELVNDTSLIKEIKDLGFDYVTLDLEGITSGSYDR